MQQECSESVLQCVEPLLCNNRKISKYTRAVSRQRPAKHVPAATNRRETIEVLLETVCLLLGPGRGVVRKINGTTKSVLCGDLKQE
jgi:hypothetical protein